MCTAIDRIADYYGKPVQSLKCCEECAELIQALIKGDIAGIVDELADVSIMIGQLKHLHGIEEAVDKRIEYKVMRQLTRLESRADHPEWVEEEMERLKHEHEL